MVTDVVRTPGMLGALLALVVVVLYGVSVGRTRALLALVSIYAGYLLAVFFPFQTRITALAPVAWQPLVGVGIFAFCYGASLMALSSTSVTRRLTLSDSAFWQIATISVVQLGLLVAVCASLVQPVLAQKYLGWAYPWIGSSTAVWAWAVAALAVLPFMRSRRRGE